MGDVQRETCNVKLNDNATIADLLKRATELESETPALDAQLLLAHVLDCTRTHLYTWPEREVPEAQATAFLDLLERRKRGEPIAHLVGRREFWSLSLAVSPATLIPRADTELLVEKALSLPLSASARVLDLGTGSGAIALALASERPGWGLLGVDSEEAAVALARRNARDLALENVDIRQSDWFSRVEGQFELIVANPPYIGEDDPHLVRGDVRFEPRSALVAARRGLADLEHLVATAPAYLAPGGWLLLEHGYDQSDPVRALFHLCGYQAVETFHDLAGNPRLSLGQRNRSVSV